MGGTVHRLPNTKLSIRSDGTWISDREPDQGSTDLTPESAASLAQAFAGNIVKTIAIEDGNPTSTAFETAKMMVDCIDLVSLPFNAIEIIGKLNEWYNGAGPDPVVQALERIDAALQRIEDVQLAAWSAARGENLAFLRAHSSSALKAARDFLEDGRPRNDPVWANKIAIAERDSLLAVQTFATDIEGGYWLRPHSLKAISWAGDPQAWMGWIPDRPASVSPGLVWDHRWALPAATYAIAIRLAVLKAFDSGKPSEARRRCQEATAYANFLGDAFNRMYAGVRQSRMKPEDYARFSQGELPAAAADINGGYFIAERILIGQPYGPLPPELYPSGLSREFSPGALIANVNLLNSYWFNCVCIRIGLPELLVFISRLQDECVAPEPPPSKLLLKHGRLVLDPRVDPDAIETLAAARMLGRISSDPEGADASSRTLDIYAALRAGGDEPRALAGDFSSQLAQIGSRIAQGDG